MAPYQFVDLGLDLHVYVCVCVCVCVCVGACVRVYRRLVSAAGYLVCSEVMLRCHQLVVQILKTSDFYVVNILGHCMLRMCTRMCC